MVRAFFLRACPKCSGDLRPLIDLFGSYLACIQCGNSVYPDSHGRFAGGRLLDGTFASETSKSKSKG